MDDRPVAGFRITSTDRQSRRSRKGRICKEEGCAVVLSVYNDGKHCSLHAPMTTVRTRGTKPAA